MSSLEIFKLFKAKEDNIVKTINEQKGFEVTEVGFQNELTSYNCVVRHFIFKIEGTLRKGVLNIAVSKKEYIDYDQHQFSVPSYCTLCDNVVCKPPIFSALFCAHGRPETYCGFNIDDYESGYSELINNMESSVLNMIKGEGIIAKALSDESADVGNDPHEGER